jgi:hypothetical protein
VGNIQDIQNDFSYYRKFFSRITYFLTNSDLRDFALEKNQGEITKRKEKAG